MKTRDLTDFFSLSGRTAVVTGGGSGLGLAVAEAFAQCGAQVSVVEVDEAAASDVGGRAAHHAQRGLKTPGGDAHEIHPPQ